MWRRDRDLGQRRTVREFIAEFRGLSGTAIQRKILNEVGCSHQSLASFFGVDRVNSDGIAKLLAAMQRAQQAGRAQASRRHRRRTLQTAVPGGGRRRRHLQVSMPQGRDDDGIPYVVEFAFGLHQTGSTEAVALQAHQRPALDRHRESRLFVTGANWSAAISNPFRRFGSTGEGVESTLAKVRANANQPVDLRAASGLGAPPVRRPRQEFDHPHRRRGAAR